MEFDLNGMFEGGDAGEAERHPINVFSKLVAEEPGNAVYRECLRNEIEDMVRELAIGIDDYRLLMLKTFTDMAPSEEQMDRVGAEPVDRIRILSFKEIVDRVFEERFLRDAGDDDGGESGEV